MASDREDFSLCGPTHLTDLDWTKENHQRCVASCLVQGIYIVERDRQLKRQGHHEALASPWWSTFGFKLIRNLIDDTDFSIFGGIYEYKPSSKPDSSAPRYIIAFRGTLTKPDSISRDFELDIHILRNGLHKTTRFEIAMQAVRSMADTNLWVTGHSMGAAMALLAGKTLAKTGVYVKSFLFNPPFVSPPIERIANERVKSGLRIAGSLITAGLALSRTIKQAQQQPTPQQQQLQPRNLSEEENALEALSSWVPEVYVNPGDHLCSEYIGFFEHRGAMEQFGYGAGIVERMAMQHSFGGLLMDAMGVSNAVGMEEPVHVIPSAKLIVNRTGSEDYKDAHGIHQWWRDDQDLVSNVYLFK
ncbi:unnamed protein product [Cochlearia groenlandica]